MDLTGSTHTKGGGMCFICGRGNCMSSFHSIEEQQAFEPAEEAYDRFLEIREQCREDWANQEEEEEYEEDGC